MRNAVKLTTAVAISIMLIATVVVLLDANFLAMRGTGTNSTTSATPGQPGLISMMQSGLAASAHLAGSQTQQQLLSDQSYWVYGGSAGTHGSTYSISTATNQLLIGIAASTEGQWVGYYAVSPSINATLAHAVLTVPSSSNPIHYSVGLYVQSTNQILNYVACLGVPTAQGTLWEVVHNHATNTTNGAVIPLWGVTNFKDSSPGDCTIITNGTNYLKVYLNHVVVYESSALQLGMQAPYNFYLESESSTTGTLLVGGYQNFYATNGENVKVTNAPSNALSAAIVDATGKVYATAPVVSGASTLVMGQYTFPQLAYVRLYSSASNQSSSNLIASTQHAVSIFGGDVFVFGSNPNPTHTSMLRVYAVDANGNNLTGISIALSKDRQTIASGFVPFTFTLNNSQSYSLKAADFGGYTFVHWNDGSTLRTRVLSGFYDTRLIAFYRLTSAPAPSGMSVLSTMAVDSGGKPLTGFTVTVYQNGVLVATSYTPTNFLLKDGTQYQVIVSNFGNYNFDHWSDGVKTSIHMVSGSSTTPLIKLVADFTGSA
jgi:hypothetical protein